MLASSNLITIKKLFIEINIIKSYNAKPNKRYSLVIDPHVNIYKNFKEPNTKDEVYCMELHSNKSCECTPDLFRCDNIYSISKCKNLEELNIIFPVLQLIINSGTNTPIQKIELYTISAEDIKPFINDPSIQTQTTNTRLYSTVFNIFENFNILSSRSYYYLNHTIKFIFIIGILNSLLSNKKLITRKSFVLMSISKIKECLLYINQYSNLEKYFIGSVENNMNIINNWLIQLNILQLYVQ